MHACCLLCCRDISTFNIFLYQATVTLHQGQSLRNDHERINICHEEVYRHVKFERHRENIVRYITASSKNCHVCDTVVTLSEGQGHRTEKRLLYTFSRTIFTANLMHGHCLNCLHTIIEHLLCS